jgi:MoaA/NifB/PqqE/SkfB family radical SAM enzyme
LIRIKWRRPGRRHRQESMPNEPAVAARAVILPRADLKVGFACNNRCVFCAQGDKRSACGSIPVDELLRRLVAVRAGAPPKDGGAVGPVSGPRGLVLTGGEPTLYKPLLKLVELARRLGYDPIQIQTNGRMLSYPHILEALLAAGANEFSPSLHGSTSAIHEGLTRAPGSFAESVAGIENVARSGAALVTNSVVTRGNTHDLPALVDLLGRLGVRHAQLAFVHPVGTALAMFDEVVPRHPDVVEPVRAARDVARRYEMRLVTEGIPLCFLRGMEELCVEDEIPPTTVVDLDGQVADYSGWRVAEGKAHGEPCRACSMRARCEGPWREYPDKFGWDEFVPFVEA